ncbi:MAG TPA: TOBE domain-containing protein, partial [Longimicrobium sp.]
RFVAGFIGSPAMNFFAGRMEGGAFAADGGALRLPLSPPWTERLRAYEGKPLTLGIRPEGLYAARGRPADRALGTGTFTVEGLEPLGNEIFVHARAGAHGVTARMAPQPLPAPGEALELAFDLGRLHFFDPETERSLVLEPGQGAESGMAAGPATGE